MSELETVPYIFEEDTRAKSDEVNQNFAHVMARSELAGHFAQDDETTAGLSWGYRGGRVLAGLEVADDVVLLPPNATRYVQIDPSTGDVTVVAGAFTAGQWPLRRLVTDAGSIIENNDARSLVAGSGGGVGPQGPQGEPGEAGEAGPQGAAGVQGVQGPAGTQGAAGSQLLTGNVAPTSGVGADGDFFVNSTNGNFYKKIAGAWVLQGSLRGPQGLPGGALNWRNDWATATAYAVDDAVQDGSPASSFRCKVAHVSDAAKRPDDGANAGDYWILFAEAGEAGLPGEGSRLRDGNGAPANGLGADGDYYLDNATGLLYRRAAGAYAVAMSLVGPQGQQGPQGVAGAAGAQGPQGPAGADGQDGAPGENPEGAILDDGSVPMVAPFNLAGNALKNASELGFTGDRALKWLNNRLEIWDTDDDSMLYALPKPLYIHISGGTVWDADLWAAYTDGHTPTDLQFVCFTDDFGGVRLMFVADIGTSDLRDVEALTPNQLAALGGADAPSGANPLVTQSALDAATGGTELQALAPARLTTNQAMPNGGALPLYLIDIDGHMQFDEVAPALIDGVAPQPGDRILVRHEPDGLKQNNGLWEATNTVIWTRPADFDENTDLQTNQTVTVLSGTLAAGRVFKLASSGAFALGTTPLLWSRVFALPDGGEADDVLLRTEGGGAVFGKVPLAQIPSAEVPTIHILSATGATGNPTPYAGLPAYQIGQSGADYQDILRGTDEPAMADVTVDSTLTGGPENFAPIDAANTQADAFDTNRAFDGDNTTYFAAYSNTANIRALNESATATKVRALVAHSDQARLQLQAGTSYSGVLWDSGWFGTSSSVPQWFEFDIPNVAVDHIIIRSPVGYEARFYSIEVYKNAPANGDLTLAFPGEVTPPTLDETPGVNWTGLQTQTGVPASSGRRGAVTGAEKSLLAAGPFSFADADIPDASLRTGHTIWVTDGNNGTPCGAISDGSNWLRLVSGGAISD